VLSLALFDYLFSCVVSTYAKLVNGHHNAVSLGTTPFAPDRVAVWGNVYRHVLPIVMQQNGHHNAVSLGTTPFASDRVAVWGNMFRHVLPIVMQQNGNHNAVSLGTTLFAPDRFAVWGNMFRHVLPIAMQQNGNHNTDLRSLSIRVRSDSAARNKWTDTVACFDSSDSVSHCHINDKEWCRSSSLPC
jgi:predicted secreted protein